MSEESVQHFRTFTISNQHLKDINDVKLRLQGRIQDFWKGVNIILRGGGSLCWFYLIFLKYPKLFHFHRILTKGGQGGGFKWTPSGPATALTNLNEFCCTDNYQEGFSHIMLLKDYFLQYLSLFFYVFCYKLNILHASGDICHLLISFAKNVGLDLDPNCLTLW